MHVCSRSTPVVAARLPRGKASNGIILPESVRLMQNAAMCWQAIDLPAPEFFAAFFEICQMSDQFE